MALSLLAKSPTILSARTTLLRPSPLCPDKYEFYRPCFQEASIAKAGRPAA